MDRSRLEAGEARVDQLARSGGLDKARARAAVGQPVENVRADLGHLRQAAGVAAASGRADGLEHGRAAHLGDRRAAENPAGDLLGGPPGRLVHRRAQRAVAGEAELAGVAGALIDDAAQGLWKGRQARPVQHHLGHRDLSRRALAAGLVVDGLGQAPPVAVSRAGEGDVPQQGQGFGPARQRDAGARRSGRHQRSRRRTGTDRLGARGLGAERCRGAGRCRAERNRAGSRGSRRPGERTGQIGAADRQAHDGSQGHGGRQSTHVIRARLGIDLQRSRVLFGEGV